MNLYSHAPLRIDFADPWSHDPDMLTSDGGCVVSAAIASYVHIEFLTKGKTIRLHSEENREHAIIFSPGQLVYDGQLDRHKAALNMLPVTGGIEVLSRTDVPPGSGLGESAALDAALIAGLAHCRMEDYDAEELVELGMLLESSELGVQGRAQDHYSAVYGGFLEVVFLPEETVLRRLTVSEDAAAELSNNLMLVYTGHNHFTAKTYERIKSAFLNGDADVVEAIAGLRENAREVGSVLEAGDWKTLAECMNVHWEFHQLLDATMKTPHTASIEQSILAAGAWGLKPTGEGAGGCFIVACPPESRESIAAAVRACGASTLETHFEPQGVTVVKRDVAHNDI